MSSVITKRFDEVFDLYLGRTPSRGDKAYWGGDNTWVSIADMSCGKYISSSKENITDEAVKETGIPIVRKGTVIMSFKLSIGKVCITDTDLFTNEAIMAFVPKSDFNILTDYLYYYLMAYKWKCSNEVVLGFTLNKKTISASMITIPTDIAEQQRIVDILDEAFEKIDALKANAEQNLQDAKALFQAALRKELKPKDGWVRKPFTDICEITSSLVDPRIDEYRSLLHIGGANIESETGVLFDLKTAEEEGLTSGKFTFDSSMVLYNKIRPYLKKVARPNFSGLCSADMYPLSPLKGTSRDFLYYLLLSDDFTKYAVEGSPRTGMPKVNRACLFAYKCYVPSENEQRSIASRLDDLNDRCKALQTNYDKTLTLCDDLKQALLRKAFNGEL